MLFRSFDKKMMSELEILFEGRAYIWNEQVLNEKRIDELIQYYRSHLADFPPATRLIKIMGMLIYSGGAGFNVNRP